MGGKGVLIVSRYDFKRVGASLRLLCFEGWLEIMQMDLWVDLLRVWPSEGLLMTGYLAGVGRGLALGVCGFHQRICQGFCK